MIPTLKSQLSPARRRLIELLQELNHGRVEGLLVRGGEPVLAELRAVRAARAVAGQRPERRLPDFLLKLRHLLLLAVLDAVADGVIPAVIVEAGLPIRVIG